MPASSSSADIDPGASASQSLPDAMLDTVLHDRYRIISKLGEGGMGVVYAAEHVHINDRFAVKLLRKEIVSNEEAVARFKQEAYSASSIKHKNIIRISDFGHLDDGRIFLCMELLDGAPLNEMIDEGLPHDRLLNILIQTGHGLAAAHRADIVHRDMKPENIFVTYDESEADVPKLLDFGIAKVSGNDGQNNLTRTGTIFGTPFYMSPEQALGQGIDARADVYAMGVIMYECFAGTVPFQGDSFMGILTQHITAEPEPVSQRAAAAGRVLPPGIAEIIAKAMAKDPDDRYQTMDDLVQDLVRVYRGVAGAGMSGYKQAHVPGPSSGAMPAHNPGIIPGVTHQAPGGPAGPPPGPPGSAPSAPYPHQPHSGPGSAGHSAPTPMPATGDSFSDLAIEKKGGKGAFIAALLLILAVGGAIAAFVIMSGSSEDGGEAAASTSTDDGNDTADDGTGDDGTSDDGTGDDGTGDDGTGDDGTGGVVADGTGDDDDGDGTGDDGAGDDDDDGTGGAIEVDDPVPVVETIKVMVDSKPTGAVVWNGNKIVDKAPVVIEVKKGEPLDLVLKRGGFRDTDVTIDGDKKKVVVRMKRKYRPGGNNNNNGNNGNQGDDDDDDSGSKPPPWDPASDLE